MEVTVNFGDIDKKVSQMIGDIDGNIRRKAGKEAGKEVAEILDKNTPWSSINRSSHKHLRDTVTVGPVAEDGKVRIGYGKDNYWRVHFPNMGTSYQNGQHFVEKTTKETTPTAMFNYSRILREELGL